MIGGRRYRMSGLLRGLEGSDGRMAGEIAAGARLVAIGPELVRADMAAEEAGLERLWRAGAAEITASYAAHGTRPWRPAHLRARLGQDGSLAVSWTPRGADIPAGLDAPDPVRSGVSFEVRVEDSSGAALALTTESTSLILNAAELGGVVPHRVSIAEVGRDGRVGSPAVAEVA